MARSQTLPYGILPPSNCSATATRPWRPLCHCAAFTLSEYLSSILTTVEGPFVLVGHSYGGSVISHPIFTKHALKSPVFISASLLHLLTSFRWSGSEQGLNLPIGKRPPQPLRRAKLESTKPKRTPEQVHHPYAGDDVIQLVILRQTIELPRPPEEEDVAQQAGK